MYKTAKKTFLNRERAIPTAEVFSVSREQADSEILSSSRNSLMAETTVQLPFLISDETSKSFPKFKATGRSMLIKFNSPGEEQEPTTYLLLFFTAITI